MRDLGMIETFRNDGRYSGVTTKQRHPHPNLLPRRERRRIKKIEGEIRKRLIKRNFYGSSALIVLVNDNTTLKKRVCENIPESELNL
jgi:hypothetical protein